VNDKTATVSAPFPAPAKPASTPAAARTKLILEGPIFSMLLRMSAPNVLNLLAFAGMVTFDGFFLGRLGSDALAGASLVFPWVMLVLQSTNFAPRRELFADILKVGVPGLVNIPITNLSVVVLTGIYARIGRDITIGYAMGARLEYIMQPLAFGFGTAILAMVGTNWGARPLHGAHGGDHCRGRVRQHRDHRRDLSRTVARPVQRRP
jgi:Na+-driven multidrug efflux pump